jgi:hypothetical protein
MKSILQITSIVVTACNAQSPLADPHQVVRHRESRYRIYSID